MPVTILQVAEARGIKKDERGGYNMGEFDRVGLPFMGGCQRCEATIAAYNAYPSKSGWLRCKDCIGDDGFETVEEFELFCKGDHPCQNEYDPEDLISPEEEERLEDDPRLFPKEEI